MFPTCFELEGSSSGRRLYVQVWYNLFTCHQYKQCCRHRSVFDLKNWSDRLQKNSVSSTLLYLLRLLIPMHVKHTIPHLYVQPSSWRWTLEFETC